MRIGASLCYVVTLGGLTEFEQVQMRSQSATYLPSHRSWEVKVCPKGLVCQRVFAAESILTFACHRLASAWHVSTCALSDRLQEQCRARSEAKTVEQSVQSSFCSSVSTHHCQTGDAAVPGFGFPEGCGRSRAMDQLFHVCFHVSLRCLLY